MSPLTLRAVADIGFDVVNPLTPFAEWAGLLLGGHYVGDSPFTLAHEAVVAVITGPTLFEVIAKVRQPSRLFAHAITPNLNAQAMDKNRCLASSGNQGSPIAISSPLVDISGGVGSSPQAA